MPEDQRIYVNYDTKWEIRTRLPTEDEVSKNGGFHDFYYINAYQLFQDGHMYLTRCRATLADPDYVRGMFSGNGEMIGQDDPNDLISETLSTFDALDGVLEESYENGEEPDKDILDAFNETTNDLREIITERLGEQALIHLKLDKPETYVQEYDAQLEQNIFVPKPIRRHDRTERIGNPDHYDGKKKVSVELTPNPAIGLDMIRQHVPNPVSLFEDLQEGEYLDFQTTGNPETVKHGGKPRPEHTARRDDQAVQKQIARGIQDHAAGEIIPEEKPKPDDSPKVDLDDHISKDSPSQGFAAAMKDAKAKQSEDKKGGKDELLQEGKKSPKDRGDSSPQTHEKS